MNEYLVITWAESVPAEDGLAEPARDRGGQLLAAGPVHDASELDSRPAPAGMVIARFSTEEAARSWFSAVAGKLDGSRLAGLDRQRLRAAMGAVAFEAEYGAGRTPALEQIVDLSLSKRA